MMGGRAESLATEDACRNEVGFRLGLGASCGLSLLLPPLAAGESRQL